MFTLGIDLGSSYTKAAVFDLTGRSVAFSQKLPAAARNSNSCPAVFELDAEECFQSVREIIDFALERYPLERVLLSTQMHGFVYKTHARRDVYVSWQDARSTLPLFGNGRTALQELGERLAPEDMLDCGVALKPSLGICNLFAMLYGEKSAPEGGELYTLGSYLIWRLTGENICHSTNAAPLGIMDVKNNRIHTALLEKAGLGHMILPRLAESDFSVCGYYEHNGRTVAVLPDFGDQQISILGSMADCGDVALNLATGGQLCLITPRFLTGSYEVRPYFEGLFLRTVSNMPSGRNLDVLIRFLQDCVKVVAGRELTSGEIWERLNKSFNKTESGLSVDCRFYPTQDHFSGGSIGGIGPLNLNLDGLLTAMYEDMGGRYARAIPELTGGNPAERLVFTGGVSWNNDALVRIAAEKIGLPFRKSASADEALNGMFRLSLVACGLLDDLSQNRDLVIETF